MTEDVETAYSEIKLFAPVDEQEAFYDAYITDSSDKEDNEEVYYPACKLPKAPCQEGTRQRRRIQERNRARRLQRSQMTQRWMVSQIAEIMMVPRTPLTNSASANQSPTAVTAQTTPPQANVEEAQVLLKKTRKSSCKKDDAALEKKLSCKENAKKEEALKW